MKKQLSFEKWGPFTYKDYVKKIKFDLKINKQTKIASLGSCFAREIKCYLQAKGYNYLTGETKKKICLNHTHKGKHVSVHGSIAWERVYNTHCFNQIVKYSFGKKYDRLFKLKTGNIADILRTGIQYKSLVDAKTDIKDHNLQSNKILSNCNILIFTLGLTEIWEFPGRNLILGYPSKGLPAKFKISTYEENLNNLQEAFDILKQNNPSLKFVITVSPVHLRATFRNDLDVISASCTSKSILRAAADTLVANNKDIYYFPSYELATIMCPRWGLNVYPDNHHVSTKVIKLIMKTFESKIQ